MLDTPARPPDYVMRLMADAGRANVGDRLLRGHLVELPGHGDVMITGDLHGNLGNFKRIVQIADLPRRPHRHLVLQELLHSMYEGTPDRSHELLEEAAVLKNVYPHQVHILLANHDVAELYRLDIIKKGRSVLGAFDRAIEDAYQFNKDVVRNAYCDFLRSLPWAAATPAGLFVCHSVPDGRYVGLFSRELFTDGGADDDLGRGSAAFRLVWGRDLSGTTAADFAQRVGADLILTGHHPVRNGYTTPNPHHIIIDSKDSRGAYVVLPLDRKLTQEEITERVRHLNF